MPIPTITELNESKQDIDSLASFINDSVPADITTRTGTVIPNLAKATQSVIAGDATGVGYDPTNDWLASLSVQSAINELTQSGAVFKSTYAEIASIDPDDYADGQVIFLTLVGDSGAGSLRKVAAHGLATDRPYREVIDADSYWQRHGDPLVSLYLVGGGVADAYTVASSSPISVSDARQEGLRLTFNAVATNTGACTLNAFGSGVDDIKIRGGILDPDAGDITAGNDVTVIDRLTYYELVRTGKKKTVIITTSGTYTPPPDSVGRRYTAIGGGGGAGGSDGQGVGTESESATGASGSMASSETLLNESATIVVGSGGAGGGAGAFSGSSGGATSITSSSVNITCLGGLGGAGMVAASTSQLSVAGAGQNASGGQINVRGSDGDYGRVLSGEAIGFSKAAATPYAGEISITFNGDGVDGQGFGQAGGATGTLSGETGNFAGGDGHQGAVIVEEWF